MNSATNRPPNDERTIAGYFRNPNDAEKAISQLSSAGFSKKDIGVALRDHSAQLRTETPAATGWAQRFRSMFQPNEREEYANKDAMDVLDHMGVPDREAQYFKQAILHGGVLLTVNTAGRNSEASNIMRSCNGVTSDNFEAQKLTSQPATESEEAENRHIELLGETLRINKEKVRTGAVKLRKEVVTERHNVEVPVEREELVIERKAANDSEAGRAELGDDREVRVPLSEERVQVEKRPVVREEVDVSKRRTQETKTVGGDVRHEELNVDEEGDVHVDDSKRRKTA